MPDHFGLRLTSKARCLSSWGTFVGSTLRIDPENRNIRLGCSQLISLGNYGLNYGRKMLRVHIVFRSKVFLTRITAPTGSSNPFTKFGHGFWSWFWILDLVLNKTNSNEKGLTLWLLIFRSKSIRPKRLGT
jgi:hypothetical protein